ncbi:hypothetical protein BJF77_04545 [Kocuria sp. CNJ-770]|nr:hypothetical protein BJF77_04545 [Kocuria sp. CNJ-770]
MPSSMPMASICSSCPALSKVERVVMRVRPPTSSSVTTAWVVPMAGSGSPCSSAKPSSNSSRRGASTAVTVHQPAAFSPSGPVM